jgi:hypothetical protein
MREFTNQARYLLSALCYALPRRNWRALVWAWQTKHLIGY